jgi:hypothetical protein
VYSRDTGRGNSREGGVYSRDTGRGNSREGGGGDRRVEIVHVLLLGRLGCGERVPQLEHRAHDAAPRPERVDPDVDEVIVLQGDERLRTRHARARASARRAVHPPPPPTVPPTRPLPVRDSPPKVAAKRIRDATLFRGRFPHTHTLPTVAPTRVPTVHSLTPSLLV